MEFVNVTGVKIPEGEVTKITETDSGRVLWSKDVKAHWEILSINDEQSWYKQRMNLVDTGDGVEFFCCSSNVGGYEPYIPIGHFSYKSNGAVGDYYTFWRGKKIQDDDIAYGEWLNNHGNYADCPYPEMLDLNPFWYGSTSYIYADIDPSTKKWVVIDSGTSYSSNGLNPIVLKMLDGTTRFRANSGFGLIQGIAWSPKLKRFCAVYGYPNDGIVNAGSPIQSILINTNGQITNYGDKQYFGTYLADPRTVNYYHNFGGMRNIIWADTLNQYIAPPILDFAANTTYNEEKDKVVTNEAYYSYCYNKLFFSSDGLTWQLKDINVSVKTKKGEIGSIQGNFLKIIYVPSLMKYVGLFSFTTGVQSSRKLTIIGTSSDCINWECIPKLHYGSDLLYSPEKEVFLIKGDIYLNNVYLNNDGTDKYLDYRFVYLSKDLRNWTPIQIPKEIATTIATQSKVKWSKSLNGFIYMPYSANKQCTGKLVIDS